MTGEEWIIETQWPRDRVRAKVRYASLLLEEARQHGARGDDFDYAHEEGCLAHLDGAVDAFLQEINVCHKLGLELWRVTARTIAEALSNAKINCSEFDELTGLLANKSSWLSEAREYRNHAIHRAAVGRNYVIVVGDSSKIQFRNPKTGNHPTVDRLELVGSWIDKTNELFERLGASLRATCGLPQR